MSSPFVLGARAEASCGLLNQTVGLHLVLAVRIQAEEASSRLAPPTFDAIQVQRQATFLRLISITEAFCGDRLLELTEDKASPTGNKILEQIWEKASTTAVSNWGNTWRAYKDWYDINPNPKDLENFTEVRNAIAHGLGNLTRHQAARRTSTVNKINSTGVSIIRDAVILEEVDLQNLKKACVDLISDVDKLVQMKTGDFN